VKPPSGRSLNAEETPVVSRLMETTSKVGAAVTGDDCASAFNDAAPIDETSAARAAMRITPP
jgi:hypothetical protein